MAHFTQNAQGKLYMVIAGNDLHVRDLAKVDAVTTQHRYTQALEIFAGLRDVSFGTGAYSCTEDYLKLPPLSPELVKVARILYHAAEVFFGIANDSFHVSEATDKLFDLVHADPILDHNASPQENMVYNRMRDILVDLASVR